ncbi:hypothetical protein Vi05172_g8121 [Venturia inaequalis]|nr:hypothetical protein Vi05172_g8121 [Venturia inaequalis]
MRIHPVVSITQLEPAPSGVDPYNRDPHPEPGPEEGSDGDQQIMSGIQQKTWTMRRNS